MLRNRLNHWIALASITLAASLELSDRSGCLLFAQAVQMTSESELLGILSSASDRGEMALACKRLAVYGSDDCVSEVAKLLSDPELASWARITLEAIPGDAASRALRDAVARLEGNLLVGVINSIGARQDEAAVELLSKHLSDGTVEVAEAAALALGRIGTAEAAQVLLNQTPQAVSVLKSVIAEGCILCAERMRLAGNTESALEIFDSLRGMELPQQRIVEATRGAILAQGDKGIDLLKEQLRSQDRKMLAVGLQTAREISSKRLGPALMEEIYAAQPERASLIVEVLADLPGQADLASLLSLAEKGSKEVRLSAIAVLGRVGDRSCVWPLLKVAREGGDWKTAVRASLVANPDAAVDQEVLGRLPDATDDKLLLLELVGLRQIQATDELIKSLASADAAVRAAALQALGETVPQERLDVLVNQVLKPQQAGDLGAAARALRTAAVRMPERDACAGLLGDAMKNASSETRTTLLETVAAVGGPKSLAILAESAKTGDESLRDASTRLLGEWMTIDVAPVLLDLATSGPVDRFQVRAMRGYIRVARQFVMSEEERVDMCVKALNAAKNVAEQKLVLEVLQRYPNMRTLKIAIDATQMPAIQNEARGVAKAIGQKLADNTEARQLLKDSGL